MYFATWASFWPVARFLSEEVLAVAWPAGHTAIELGCGIGLPGIAALAAGLDVTFTDYDATALRFAAENARRNGFPNPRTALLDWRTPPVERYDVVLASDLLYEERSVEPLAASIAALMAPGGVALVADNNRPHAPEFKIAIEARGMTWEARPHHMKNDGGYDVNGTIYRLTWR